MSKIIITKHFQKNLSKIKIVTLDDVVYEIKKYNKGLNNLINLYSPIDYSKILKGYLGKGKVRIIILLMIDNNTFAPLLIEKKESKYGYNLSKDTAMEFIEHKSKLILKDIKNKNFFKIQL